MKRMLAFFITCCLLSISYVLFADSGDKYLQTAVRPITHTTADSTVRLHVRVSSEGVEKLSDELFYYWEKNGTVHKNQGSFSGNILHGRYTVTNAKGMMVTEGYFFNGTKDRYWKRWDDRGVLTQAELWKEGQLKKAERYDNGSISEEVAYGKNGKPKKKLDYTSGKKKVYVYKTDEWVAKRKLKLFSKKQKQVETDSLTVSSPE